jgi:hypothetical protein
LSKRPQLSPDLDDLSRLGSNPNLASSHDARPFPSRAVSRWYLLFVFDAHQQQWTAANFGFCHWCCLSHPTCRGSLYGPCLADGQKQRRRPIVLNWREHGCRKQTNCGLFGRVFIIICAGEISIELLLLMHVSRLALPRNVPLPLSSSLDWSGSSLLWSLRYGDVGESAQGQRHDAMTTLGVAHCAYFLLPAIIH